MFTGRRASVSDWPNDQGSHLGSSWISNYVNILLTVLPEADKGQGAKVRKYRWWEKELVTLSSRYWQHLQVFSIIEALKVQWVHQTTIYYNCQRNMNVCWRIISHKMKLNLAKVGWNDPSANIQLMSIAIAFLNLNSHILIRAHYLQAHAVTP